MAIGPKSRPAIRKKMKTSKYINRDVSWLEFNRRVLQEAQNETTPLLERAKFLAIVSSNLDEFMSVRVAGIMEQVKRNACKGWKSSRAAIAPQWIFSAKSCGSIKILFPLTGRSI
jgi:polyphosphate kinase